MSTQPPRRNPNQPHATRGEKVRNAKSDMHGGVGRGMGEAPQSRAKKFGLIFLVVMLVLFLITSFTDRV